MNTDKIILGCWQLAGGHGEASVDQRIADLIEAYDQGFRKFDCADIYTGVEELLGQFLCNLENVRGAEAASSVKIHTKCVPDLKLLSPDCAKTVEKTVRRSATRLRREQLDLVQFHWWDYAKPGALETLGALLSLKKQGEIAEVGLTNFDTAHTKQFVEAGIPIFSTQVQYSLLDRRPAATLAPYCLKHQIKMYCYGSLAGGLLSEKYLGAAEPVEPLENRSLVKYKLIVDEVGSWDFFQELLSALKNIGKSHNLSISETAMSYCLSQLGVSALIVGHRSRDHLKSINKAAASTLANSDLLLIKNLLTKGHPVRGEVYEAERDRNGPHGRIMRYNLNSA